MEIEIKGSELTDMFENWCKDLPKDHPYQPERSKREDTLIISGNVPMPFEFSKDMLSEYKIPECMK